MTRDIIVSNKEFTQYLELTEPLVADDVHAYRIVYKPDFDVTGATFKVTATRQDGLKIADAGAVENGTGYYILKNNMYSVVGETRLRLTFINGMGTVLTTKELICPVAEANGETDANGDDRVPILTTLIANAGSAIAYANAQGNYAKEQGDYAKDVADTFAEKQAEWDKNGNYSEIVTMTITGNSVSLDIKCDGVQLIFIDWGDGTKEKYISYATIGIFIEHTFVTSGNHTCTIMSNKITYFNCMLSNLISFDVSGLAKLTNLNCTDNNLTSLNISDLIELTTLYCSFNNFPSLDLSSLTKLTILECNFNNLTSLNIDGLTELAFIDCTFNYLSQVQGNAILSALPSRVGKTKGTISIIYQKEETLTLNTSIATAKNWEVY